MILNYLVELNLNMTLPLKIKLNFNKIASNVVRKYNREVKLKKFPSTKFTYN